MPSPRKPADRRQNHKTADLQLVAGGKAEVVTPDPPDGLLPETAEWWGELWSSDIRQAWERSDWPALRRLAEMYDERERALKAYRSQRLVEGSQGQPVLNPMWKVAEQLDKEIRQLEDRFGLSPKARLQLGITFGQAQTSMQALMEAMTDGESDDDPFADQDVTA